MKRRCQDAPDQGGFVQTLIEREEVGSTSDLARDLVRTGGVALPLLVVADRQTAGRGRGSHAWWSDEGSLTWTLAIDPAAHGLKAEQHGRVALASALAVIEALGPILKPGAAGIRWPNDVEVEGRKLGGILPETIESIEGPRLLMGIGLNVSTRLEAAPAAVRWMATTVERERRNGVGPVDRTMLLEAILDRLAKVLSTLARDDPALAEHWERLDSLRGRRVRVALGPKIVAGTGRGIDARGGLRLETTEGLVTLFGGQVLRDDGGGETIPHAPTPNPH